MKSFEELFNEFNNDEEIKKTGQEVVNEIKKRNKITLILCLTISAILIYFLAKHQMGMHIKNVRFILYLIPAIMSVVIPTIMANVIIMVITSTIFSKKQGKFLPIFKEKVIKKMIDNFLDDMEYFPKKQMPEHIYNEGKYESYDNYYSDDYIEAKIDGKYLIELGEVETEEEREERDSNGNTRTVTHTLFDRFV